MTNKIWLLGAGPMAIEYAKVLNAIGVSYMTIGRGFKNASNFKEKTGKDVLTGGLFSFLNTKPTIPNQAIVATGVEALSETTIQLIKYGVKNILCEKPGGLNHQEIKRVAKQADESKAVVLLGYNRRFYSSVIKAREIIDHDGGVSSFYFEFTEWGHVIEPIIKGPGVKENWFLSNSTHVVDLAFYLGGLPKKIKCFTSGGLSWHPSATIFSGAGISETDALFSYQANWTAPGRWAVEILTSDHRLYLKPLENLQIQKKGSVIIEPVIIDDKLDREFKPGLYLQTRSFIEGSEKEFIDIHDQDVLMPVYKRMANYPN